MSRSLRVVALPVLLLASLAMAASPEDSEDWPKQIDLPDRTVVLYQPQPESLKGPTLTGQAAFSSTPKSSNQPTFGALWFTASVSSDRDRQMLDIHSVKVNQVRLPDAQVDDQQRIATAVEQAVPTWGLAIPLSVVTAGLAQLQEGQAKAEDLKAEPPKIVFASEPTVLVVLDGQPVLRPIEDSPIQSVINTPFPLFFDPASKTYYLTNGALWYQTRDLLGGWDLIPQPPPAVAAVLAKGGKDDQSAPAPENAKPPSIRVATEPTELIVADGQPNFAPLTGTQLLYVTNTESEVFRDIETQKVFVVLSGRWYSAPGFGGPWTFVASNALPPEFASIPSWSPKAEVLAYVSGTEQAKEAVLDTQIPQTAAIKRDAPGPAVNYDGQPDFQPVQGTSMTYAVNTPSSVLYIQGRYYNCADGVWYVAPGPQGPWAVADVTPPDIQQIPPSSPVYNVKYVTVYQTTPEVVYVGYTPGYLGSYVWNGAVVYGTGWYYRPYVSRVVYVPRPFTWGLRVSYSPWTGWGYGVGWTSGFLWYGAHWGGTYYRPPWRPAWGGGWYGPGGYRPIYRPVARAIPGRPVPPRPIYAYPPRSVGNLYARPSVVHNVVGPRPGGPVAAPRPQAPRPVNRLPNNVYTDRNGNIYRHDNNGAWQQRDRQGWKPAPAPSTPAGPVTRPAPGSPSPGGPVARPGPTPMPTTPRPQGPGSRPAPSPIERDYRARVAGNQRAAELRPQAQKPQKAPKPQHTPKAQKR